MKVFFIVIIMMLSINSVEAEKIYIVDNATFDLGNGANITLLKNQTFDAPINLQENFTPILHIRINGSEMRYSTISDKTISNITYNFSSDKFVFDAIGISDKLNMTATMRRINVSYNFSVDTLVVTANKTDSNKQVSFTFNGWSQHNFIIEVNGSSIILRSVSGYIINRINETLYNANVSIPNSEYTHSDTSGFYDLTNLESGNYIIKSVLFPYSNKTVQVSVGDNDITNFNITMKIPSGGGGVGYKNDYTPIYLLVFMITIMILYKKKFGRNNDKE